MCNLNVVSLELGFTTSHGAPSLSPKYDMNVYMATLFGGETWNLC